MKVNYVHYAKEQNYKLTMLQKEFSTNFIFEINLSVLQVMNSFTSNECLMN